MAKKTVYRKLTGVMLALLVIFGSLTPQATSYFYLPQEQRLTVGDELRINLSWPSAVLRNLTLQTDGGDQGIFQAGQSSENRTFNVASDHTVATQPGKTNVSLKLFGVLTVRKMAVEVFPKIRLVPGGHSIGVLLKSDGVMVVGISVVDDAKGGRHHPAAEAGLEVGDLILSIDGKKVASDEEMAEVINKAGTDKGLIQVRFKREGKVKTTEINPVYCRDTKRYRIGLLVRDSAAGVGTMTFYDPQTGQFGALGHIINDSDTNKPINVKDGKVVRASVQGIQKGQEGKPGEKIGMFLEDKNFEGEINKNCKYGIYGVAKKIITNPVFTNPLPVALADQVEEGPAEILTVVSGEKIEKYNIEITRLLPHNYGGKGMTLKITDKKLLDKTGGIIQGMSGSPIIQKGKIVGAVTHVFINDPTKGYGVFIEWMLKETKIIKSRTSVEKVGMFNPTFSRLIVQFAKKEKDPAKQGLSGVENCRKLHNFIIKKLWKF